jgi:hypothetical protein
VSTADTDADPVSTTDTYSNPYSLSYTATR